MSLLGTWHEVQGSRHYWRDGFVRSGCGILGPVGPSAPPPDGITCVPCRERHQLDMKHDVVEIEHMVKIDDVREVRELCLPLTQSDVAWLTAHSMKPKPHRDHTEVRFVFQGEHRKVIVPDGHWLVVSTAGYPVSVEPAKLWGTYRPVTF